MNLVGRSLLTLKDYSSEEILYLLDLAKRLKEKKHQGIKGHLLEGKNVVLLFDKTSTRTRCAFEVACFDEGAGVTFLTNSQMGKKESIADTAQVLGRMYDGIEYRGSSQKLVEDLAKYSHVPVWNGLTDDYHPTQILADMLTVSETVQKPFSQVKFVYAGDARNNMGNSLLIGAVKLGMHFVAYAPKNLFPNAKLVNEMQELAKTTGATIELSDNIDAVIGADVVYTDVWVSMGEEEHFPERIAMLKNYQVNQALIDHTNNPNVVFLHCLPAFHNRETMIGEEIYQKYGLSEMEVSDEVFSGKHSHVFDQAENRLHTIKAVMVATLVGDKTCA